MEIVIIGLVVLIVLTTTGTVVMKKICEREKVLPKQPLFKRRSKNGIFFKEIE